MLVLTSMSSNMADGNQQTSVTEFCYKSVNLFFEKLINMKVMVILIHELFEIAKFLEMSHFFNLHDSSLGRRITQKLKNSSVLHHKTKNLLKQKFV